MDDQVRIQRFIERIQRRQPALYAYYDYSDVEYNAEIKKFKLRCPAHGEFWTLPGDHASGYSGCSKCSAEKRKKTITEKYGVDNFFKRKDLVKAAMLEKHGVENPGQLLDHASKVQATSMERYGAKWAANIPEVNVRRKATNMHRYGVDVPIQNPAIAKKAVESKVKSGGFTKSNSSKAATKFIRQYIVNSGYSFAQCAYADPDRLLHEWGLYVNGRWMLFDLVVFEQGCRGNKDKIIEILEYQGPFHYTVNDAEVRGNEQAYPWKSNKTTILESVMRDKEKQKVATTLTSKFTVIWEKDL